MRIGYFLACALAALSFTQTRAAEGFVIESDGASAAVGAAIDDTTTVSIGAGGHLVILTSTGQMLRRNGPFEGAALAAMEGSAGSAVRSGALDALVDLALEKGAAQNRVFATRSAVRSSHPGPFSISPQTTVYCHRPGIAPEFTLSPTPSQDLPLILDRVSKPKSTQNGYWSAGQPRFAWPPDWPPPAKGSYAWSAGYAQGAFSVKVVKAKADPADLPAIAAELKRLGCNDQAIAALQEAIAQATVLE